MPICPCNQGVRWWLLRPPNVIEQGTGRCAPWIPDDRACDSDVQCKGSLCGGGETCETGFSAPAPQPQKLGLELAHTSLGVLSLLLDLSPLLFRLRLLLFRLHAQRLFYEQALLQLVEPLVRGRRRFSAALKEPSQHRRELRGHDVVSRSVDADGAGVSQRGAERRRGLPHHGRARAADDR